MMKKKRRMRPAPKMSKVDRELRFSYQDVGLIKRYTNSQGSILPRSLTNLTQKQQRGLATAIKRARHLALLPFTPTV